MEKLKHGALALSVLLTKQVLAKGKDLTLSDKEKDGSFTLTSKHWPDDYESSGVATGCTNWYNSCSSGQTWSVPSFAGSDKDNPAHAWFCSDAKG